MRKWILLISCLGLVGIIVYQCDSFLQDVEVNTVNPQSSRTLTESRNNGFFVCEYMPIDKPKYFTINAIWIERVWKNTGSEKKKIGNNYQLIMSLTNLRKMKQVNSSYFIDWKMRHLNQTFGRRSGNFILFIKRDELVDTLKIDVIDQKKDTIDSFCIIKR